MVTIGDRVEIGTGSKPGWLPAMIAVHVRRHKSEVHREIARNATEDRGNGVMTADPGR